MQRLEVVARILDIATYRVIFLLDVVDLVSVDDEDALLLLTVPVGLQDVELLHRERGLRAEHVLCLERLVFLTLLRDAHMCLPAYINGADLAN